VIIVEGGLETDQKSFLHLRP